MPVTLINAFIVPLDREAEFLAEWRVTARYFEGKAGFIETHMHRNAGIGNPTMRFINIARWESADAWRATHDEYQPKENLIPGVKGHPAIFDCIVDIHNPDAVAAHADQPFISAGFFPPAKAD